MSEDRKKQPKLASVSLKDEGEDGSMAQEISSLQEVFKVLVKALKNLKIYLANNPVHQRFIKEFYSKLDIHLKTYGDSILTVGQYTLTYHDQIIYENINRLDSLAFKLFVDGVRQITLLEGISEEESSHFLDVLGKSYDSDRPDDDLVTLLWQKKFHHIKFQIIEDYFTDGDQALRINEPEAKAGFDSMIQAELKNQDGLDKKETEAGNGTSLADEQASKLHYQQVFRLTEDEILSIKKEMKIESEKDLISELIQIIYSVLQVEKDDRFFLEMVDLLVKNSVHLIEEGDLVQIEKIARLFITLKEQIPPLGATKVEILDQAVNSLGKPEYLSKIESHLNLLDEVNLSSLASFLNILNPSAAYSIIDILSKAKVRKTRKLISDILVEFGKKDMTPILSRLQGSQWYVIRNLLQIIGQIGSPQGLDSIKKLIHYPDERVRKEIVYTLMLIGKDSDKATDMILTFLDDHDAGIRKQVIQIIQTNKYEKALPILKKMISEENLWSRDSEEKHLVFSALGRLGKKDLLPMLKNYLRPTFLSFFKRGQKEDQAICALYALRHMECSEAVDLLNEAKKHPYKLVSDFAVKALYEIQKSKDKKELKEKHESQNSN
ncbi:MAG: HEAT repeat domain-containing protein [Nitrospiria bacterium]